MIHRPVTATSYIMTNTSSRTKGISRSHLLLPFVSAFMICFSPNISHGYTLSRRTRRQQVLLLPQASCPPRQSISLETTNHITSFSETASKRLDTVPSYSLSFHHGRRSSLTAKNGNVDGDDDRLHDSDNIDIENLADSSLSAIDIVGIICQPIVWLSLWIVATTGHGLPPGPFGLLGAMEGVAYLIVVCTAFKNLVDVVITNTGRVDGDGLNPVTESDFTIVRTALSTWTLLLSLVVVTKLQADQGCIPNAKPILDYSAIVQVCGGESN